jgi:hypothetical protein
MNIYKILYCYPNYPSSNTYGDVEKIWLNHIAELNNQGFDAKPFCLSLNPPSYAIPFPKLDRLWKTGDKELLRLYERLEYALMDRNVLLNSTGLNLHPEFVEKLSVFKVFQFNDDPESSDLHSKYMAKSYDLSLVGNIAEVKTYKSWGVENVEWMPIGLRPGLYNKSLGFDQTFSFERDIDLFMMIDKESKWRKERLKMLGEAFPYGEFYGKGWEKGYLPPSKEISYLLRSKISPNLHNSTGPINYRTFYTPANGALLICDNKSNLGKIFKLGEEAIGFDSIEECVELINHFLANELERESIARNGYLRVMKDYTEIAVYKRTLSSIENVILNRREILENKSKENIVINYSKNKSIVFLFSKLYFYFQDFSRRVFIKISRVLKWL